MIFGHIPAISEAESGMFLCNYLFKCVTYISTDFAWSIFVLMMILVSYIYIYVWLWGIIAVWELALFASTDGTDESIEFYEEYKAIEGKISVPRHEKFCRLRRTACNRHFLLFHTQVLILNVVRLLIILNYRFTKIIRKT